ncbi:FMN-binding protein [Peptoniphilus asaccharolyticus]
MSEPVKFGAILLLFCAISAGLLAFVNSMTVDVIAQAQLEQTLNSYKTIFGDEADAFEEYDQDKLDKIQEKYPEIEAIFVAEKAGQKVGYGVNVTTNGFGGAMTNALGIKIEGDEILGYRNITHQETKGFGTQITEESYISSYKGKSVSEELVLSKDPKAPNEIMQISGATVSSKGVFEGDKIVAEVYNNILKAE